VAEVLFTPFHTLPAWPDTKKRIVFMGIEHGLQRTGGKFLPAQQKGSCFGESELEKSTV